jgi:serine protease Do
MKITRIGSRAIAPVLATGIAFGTVALSGAAPAFLPSAAAAAVPQGGYVALVERVAPAVVYIEVTRKPEARPAGLDRRLPEGSPLEEFMRRFGMPDGGDTPHGAPGMTGVGTGFIISADGQIVTNAHVVEGAETISVTLSDGRKVDAQLVGADEATDIAVVRVSVSEPLPVVAFGALSDLRVGQDVVAIGNPFGLGNTVTSGIVSALGRDINSGPFDDYIQTDAAINKGNSGGPLFDAQGAVIGINTAIVSPTGGSVGIGFAVPSDTASRVVADLLDDGTVDRGWLGVQIQPVSDEVAAALGLDAAKGVLIAAVTGDTPAAAAGMERGDIVIRVDGAAVDAPRDLTRMIAGEAPGTEVRLSILRAGKPVDLTVTLGTRPEQPA